MSDTKANTELESMDFIFDIHQTMRGKELNLVYEGNVTQEITKSVLAMAERNMDTSGEETSVKKKVFNVMAECLQNICKHSDEVNDDQSASAIFIIGREKGDYVISTGNPVLKEKINREKGVILDSFIATVHYGDNTSRTVTSLKFIERYLETRDVLAVGVTLEWHIITRLESSKGTETQKVEVTFNTLGELCKGDISLSIEHTNQAWGNEVLYLFKDKISETTV
ncbi:MAG: hypothetical protein JKY33_01170, partial [Bacteroidia bacterium]|nr:hypothetical protein [Bacteroidia bacterium]